MNECPKQGKRSEGKATVRRARAFQTAYSAASGVAFMQAAGSGPGKFRNTAWKAGCEFTSLIPALWEA